MSPVDHEVVRRKLAVLQNALAALAESGPIGLDAYRSDFWRRKGTERVLQEMIEAGMDVATHVLVQTGRAAPADGRAAFLELGSALVISPELAQALAPAVGLRNRLVHEYEEIDDRIVLEAVGQAQSLFPRFVAEIEGFLGRTP
ncbi:MAG TPA: DUF86 domain-containing protein [Myxococcaceae bacterium]|nr:DUF86 domain-containing protein [Myxococcaceae bacterium]